MAHARTTIRKAFVEILKGNTTAKDHVYDSRLYTLEEAVLPAIIIFASQEEVITTTNKSATFARAKLEDYCRVLCQSY